MASERVKPGRVDHTVKLNGKILVEGDEFFARSTILRVIDEETARLLIARDGAHHPSERLRRSLLGAEAAALIALRARFEEADEPQSVLGMEVRVSPYIPRNVIYVGREITPEEWRSMLREADDDE